MFNKITNLINNILINNISQESLVKIQNMLIQINIYAKIEELITFILLITLVLFFVSLLGAIILNFPLVMPFIVSLMPSIFIVFYVVYKNEHRKEQIEEDLPDYLHQISSLLKVGLGLESALYELSENTKSPLNNEIKRVLLEMRLGKSFNDSILDMADRLDLDNVGYVFQIIIHTKESGGNLADILDDIANDLTDMNLLKKQRKSSIMMSVVFLLVSSIVAIPFALGMIGLYSEFIGQIGKYNQLNQTIPTASIGYIVIHSILVSILLGIVMYSNYKKGIKYLFAVLPSSLAVYYVSKMIFSTVLGIGGI